jgi:endoglucanase
MKQGGHPGPTLLLSGHSDEVGFMVKKIESSGLLRFEKIGGHDDRIIPCEQVIVSTATGPVLGVIGTISAHFSKYDDPKKVRHYKEMYIDIGARDAAGAMGLGVRVGDPVTWATPYREIGQNRADGHGFDDKAGCAVIANALETLDFSAVHGTVYASFSVQEELGLRGAHVAAEQVSADVAIAVDTTAVTDTPEGVWDNGLQLGAGPAVKYMDFSLVASRKVVRALESTAERLGIPCQQELFPGIGTDAGELHKAHAGVPSGVISIPSRYAHSPNEVIDLGDLDGCADLLRGFILDMRSPADFAFLPEIK